ncbi:dihydrodipicolinate synthase family protein [Humitalea sp. 24SJ18S-53]|uniref:dihydrodipicolinate synthase family protein n=1 Tax=Humitalea sp. 24SJ18S-53 TaxID=3422307 RepID=UPI003D6642CE
MMQSWVVSITPFDADGGLDEHAFRLHLRRIRAAGAAAYVGSSNVGEGFTLSAEERDRVFAIAVEELKGRVPVRAAGCEPRGVADALDYLRAAARAGLDAAHLFQLDNGHTGKPNAAEMERFYDITIGEATLPVVISSYPSMGYALPIDLVARLLDRHPQIVAVRAGGGDPLWFAEAIRRFKGRALVYAAGVPSILPALHLGADGFLSGEGNLVPGLTTRLITAARANDFATMQAAYQDFVGLHAVLGKFGGGRGVKPLLNALGLPGGSIRPPRLPIDDTAVAGLVEAVRALDLPELRPPG